ncbi:SLBB domain-containing protein [Candidatus Marinimicrobia bacterium]|nr:SLBB domain-containing protein [Candidatus Neomarinimicrobiota bacterium]
MNIIKYIFLSYFYLSLLIAQTDFEVKQIKQYMKKTGISISEAKKIAKQKGYSDSEINAVIEKEKYQNKKKQITENLNKLETSDNFIIDDKVLKQEVKSEKNDIILGEILNEDLNNNFFGYAIFKNDPSIFQSSSVGSVDPSYSIGPGDEIIVMLWGETQFREVLQVNREGFIFIPEIGQVFVNGLNLKLLESKLSKVLSQSYASLDPQNKRATTFLDISIGNLRPLRIQVLGEVDQPGAYTVSPSTTLFSALYYFNGPSNLGSLRDIRLIRSGEQVATIDFYDFLLTGKKPNDVMLQLDDIIFIPGRKKTVQVEGSVKRPGIYELKQDEGFKELIEMAGQLEVTAYLDRAQIDRIIPFNKRKEYQSNIIFKDVDLSDILKNKSTVELMDGDKIKIFSILDSRQNVVNISGAIKRPGEYEIENQMTLSQLIKKAEGLLGDAYLDKINLIRTKPDFSEELIELDLSKVLIADSKDDIVLKGLDKITVFSISKMVESPYVFLEGHVKRQGAFPLRKNMTIYDLIFDGEGLVDKDFINLTFLNRVDLIRVDQDGLSKKIIRVDIEPILKNKDIKENIMLQRDDKLRVYPKSIFFIQNKVEISGNINLPGTYLFKKEMFLKDLILEAGSFKNKRHQIVIEIARRLTETNKNEILSFKLKNLFTHVNEKNSAHLFQEIDNVKLEPNDNIIIRENLSSKIINTVIIKGAVYLPGKYIINENDKFTDLIERAGGLVPSAYLAGSTYSRNGEFFNINLEKAYSKPKSDFDLTLKHNDKIVINKSMLMVQILGEVSVPGNYVYVPKKRLKDFIRSAGSFTKNADKKNITITYPNGENRKVGLIFKNNKIIDGTIIYVSKKKEKEDFDMTEYLKELTAIVANLSQTLALIFLTRS